MDSRKKHGISIIEHSESHFSLNHVKLKCPNPNSECLGLILPTKLGGLGGIWCNCQYNSPIECTRNWKRLLTNAVFPWWSFRFRKELSFWNVQGDVSTLLPNAGSHQHEISVIGGCTESLDMGSCLAPFVQALFKKGTNREKSSQLMCDMWPSL